jgi:phosphoribosylglycinamide formyltransferase, formyltetrahydrofolate-dependent
MKKIAVLVSGGGTNLQALIDAIHNGKITNGKITLVISSKSDAYALERAANNNIAKCVINPKEFDTREQFTSVVVKTLLENNIDLVVLGGFMYVLKEEFTNVYRNRILNVHPALIPSFCGMSFYGLRVHKAVLEAGVKLTGATVHFVNEICDGGPIILQKAIDIKEGDTPETLQRRVMEECEWVILAQAVDLICNDRVTVDENNITHITEEH